MDICEAVQCITLMAWLWVPNELVYVSQTVPVDQNKRSLKKRNYHSPVLLMGHNLLSLPLMSSWLTTCMTKVIHVLQYSLIESGGARVVHTSLPLSCCFSRGDLEGFLHSRLNGTLQ